MNDKILLELKRLLNKAAKENEVPVAAVLVRNKKIISKGYNKKNKTSNPLMHAEVICILKGFKKIKDWRFEDCELYVTLEPCDMCKKIIEEARIKKVYYISEKTNRINHKTEYVRLKIDNSHDYTKILKEFFQQKR